MPQLQPILLRAVLPSNNVNGFDIEVIRHEQNLIAGQVLAKHFCNRYIQINASCDGSNPRYPERTSLTLHVTQYATTDQSAGITPQGDVGIVVLRTTESLYAAGIYEITQNSEVTPVLMLWFKDSEDGSTSTAVYALTTQRRQVH
jgi:hypothetical protein